MSGCSTLPGKKETKNVEIRNKAAEYLKNGNAQFNMGRYGRALELFEMAEQLNASLDYEEGLVAVYNSIGQTLLMAGRFDDALDILNSAMAISVRLDINLLIMKTSGNLADYYIKVGNLAEAERILRDVLPSPQSVDSAESALAAHKFSLLMRKQGNLNEALTYLESSIKYNEKNKLYKALGTDYYLMASIYSLKKEYDQAVFFGEEALRYDKMVEFAQGIAADLEALSIIYKKAGREPEAEIFARRYEKAKTAIIILNKIEEDQVEESSSGE
ncbi:MAG: tetratricopeptide repeat protein [Spirochaetales bacterium]|nr:tetratricopeptide repeat protein [Spirochaetales bacterium]